MIESFSHMLGSLVSFFLCSNALLSFLLALSADVSVAAVPASKLFTYNESGGMPRAIEVFFPARQPDSGNVVPGVLLFHGGAWRAGSRSSLSKICLHLAERGIVAASADYKVMSEGEAAALPAGESNKRVCIQDARSAIRWFGANAHSLGVDPNRIIIGGASAGAQIAVLAMLNSAIADPADAPAGMEPVIVASILLEPAFGMGDSKDPQVDVMKFLDRRLPPCIIVFGAEDALLKQWSLVSAEFAKRYSPEFELYVAEGQKHNFHAEEPWRSAVFKSVDQFLIQRGLLPDGQHTSEPELSTQKSLHLSINKEPR